MAWTDIVRPLLKRVLPRRVRQLLHQVNIKRDDGRFAGLERGALFDTIYRTGIWSHEDAQLSGPGSYGRNASEYVAFVRDFIRRSGVQTVLDIGCGDFHVGSQICDAVPRYIAADVSQVIIDRNRDAFGNLPNVEFRRLDVCAGGLPAADLVTVREVLQHLSNAEVEAALDHIGRSGARFVLVTEHLPADDLLRAPNLDKPSGPNVRNPFGSGVYIGRPPFNRPAQVVLSVRHPLSAGAPSNLVTSLWRPHGGC